MNISYVVLSYPSKNGAGAKTQSVQNSIALLANYVTVVEDVMPVKYCLPVPVFHFWP